jgi:hypothetical protein
VQSSEHRENKYDRPAKKKQKVLDDVDIFLANKKSVHNTTLCINHHPPTQMTEECRELDYWDSGEAIKLFNPTLGKSVKQCLCDRDKLLQKIIEDDDKVETIIKDWNNDRTAQFTARQERRIVTQCKQRYLKEDLVALCGPRNIFITMEEQKGQGWVAWKAQRNASDTMGAWLDRLQQSSDSKKHALLKG